jgi:hypothetical protein
MPLRNFEQILSLDSREVILLDRSTLIQDMLIQNTTALLLCG